MQVKYYFISCSTFSSFVLLNIDSFDNNFLEKYFNRNFLTYSSEHLLQLKLINLISFHALVCYR